MKVLIIIPAYNEEANIEKVVDYVIAAQRLYGYDYIVINDGSYDTTEEICNKKGYNILSLPVNLGIGGAVQAGYLYALKNHYDIAVQIDGDGQHDAMDLPRIIEQLVRENADIAIGSRFIDNQGFQSSRARRAGIKFLSGLIWLCTGKRVYDVTSGFRVINNKAIRLYATDYPVDYPEPEAIIMAALNGMKIIEIPVIMHERSAGESSINLWKSIYYMIKVSLAVIIRRISLGIRR